MIKYNNTPTIVVEDNVLSPDLCEHIINLAENKGLGDNLINRKGKYIQDKARTSKGAFFDYGDNNVLDGVIEALSDMCGLPPTRLEPVTIQRYQSGQEYKPHYDAFLPNEMGEMPKSSKIEEGGNRCVTMIAYLNDVRDGGGTVFPVAGLAIQAVQGRVLMFGNLDENKVPHPASLHMGLPPENGDKWIITFWFREKDVMVTKKELKNALKSKQSVSTEKKPVDSKLHAKNVYKKFKEITEDRGSMPL
jgi:prolyl 4-hydroxylase|tara:strand:- start:2841 stop:3584 length:744 start_codon:yes stop_codon:yes gene_type:complete